MDSGMCHLRYSAIEKIHSGMTLVWLVTELWTKVHEREHARVHYAQAHAHAKFITPTRNHCSIWQHSQTVILMHEYSSNIHLSFRWMRILNLCLICGWFSSRQSLEDILHSAISLVMMARPCTTGTATLCKMLAACWHLEGIIFMTHCIITDDILLSSLPSLG